MDLNDIFQLTCMFYSHSCIQNKEISSLVNAKKSNKSISVLKVILPYFTLPYLTYSTSLAILHSIFIHI